MEKKLQADLGYNLVLIGFMGAGKSTIAAYLNEAYGMEIAEMDQWIEEREGMRIAEIFEKYGEEYFRKKETELLKELQTRTNMVISCGGGIVTREENIPLMKKNGRVILLTATPQTVLERVKDQDDRPILQGNKTIEYISELLERRREQYEAAADFTIQTDGKSTQVICEELMEQLNHRWEKKDV